jgi:hypothetical protein
MFYNPYLLLLMYAFPTQPLATVIDRTPYQLIGLQDEAAYWGMWLFSLFGSGDEVSMLLLSYLVVFSDWSSFDFDGQRQLQL